MRATLYDSRESALVSLGRELVERWRAEPETTTWVDLERVDDVERDETLRGSFGTHPFALQDALRARHPPRFARFGDVLFLMLPELDGMNDENMPALGTRWGYFIVLTIMGCVVAFQLYPFRRM